jgi:putative nucleotidyltransferase with HDIG domain
MRDDSAALLAGGLLAEVLPRRWAHVQAVAKVALSIRAVVPVDSRLLVAAAWLHDVGYAPDLAETGFHPLDGARYLRAVGVDERLCCLVANHSAALIEAEARGLAGVLRDEFPAEESAVTDALWYCDLTTGPDGQRFPLGQRLAEIRARYGPEDVVTCFTYAAESVLSEAVERTERRLAQVGLA